VCDKDREPPRKLHEPEDILRTFPINGAVWKLDLNPHYPPICHEKNPIDQEQSSIRNGNGVIPLTSAPNWTVGSPSVIIVRSNTRRRHHPITQPKRPKHRKPNSASNVEFEENNRRLERHLIEPAILLSSPGMTTPVPGRCLDAEAMTNSATVGPPSLKLAPREYHCRCDWRIPTYPIELEHHDQ